MTFHATTGVAPSVMLMKQTVRNKMPHMKNTDPVSKIIREHDSTQKERVKAHADRKCNVKTKSK